MLRIGGLKAALLTLGLDSFKGFAAVIVAAAYDPALGAFAALGAVVGHCWPLWWTRGGKAVATAIGVVFALAWPVGILFCGAWILATFVWRKASLSALVSVLTLPITAYVLGYSGIVWLMSVLVVLFYERHRANIRRILRGEEPEIKLKASV